MFRCSVCRQLCHEAQVRSLQHQIFNSCWPALDEKNVSRKQVLKRAVLFRRDHGRVEAGQRHRRSNQLEGLLATSLGPKVLVKLPVTKKLALVAR